MSLLAKQVTRAELDSLHGEHSVLSGRMRCIEGSEDVCRWRVLQRALLMAYRRTMREDRVFFDVVSSHPCCRALDLPELEGLVQLIESAVPKLRCAEDG